jgi:hypothetical protein
LVAIEPAAVNVNVDHECGEGGEAVGVLTFLMKVFLRCTPIAFAAAVTCLTQGLVDSNWADHRDIRAVGNAPDALTVLRALARSYRYLQKGAFHLTENKTLFLGLLSALDIVRAVTEG